MKFDTMIVDNNSVESMIGPQCWIEIEKVVLTQLFSVHLRGPIESGFYSTLSTVAPNSRNFRNSKNHAFIESEFKQMT